MKSGVCRSKNEQVIAVGTKEDGHSTLYSSDYTVKTCFAKFEKHLSYPWTPLRPPSYAPDRKKLS